MSYGPISVFPGTIASGESTLTSIDLSKAWSRVFIEVPSLSTAVVFDVYGSSDNSTFRPVFSRTNTQVVAYQALTVATTVTNGIAPLDGVGTRYVQLRGSATVANGVAIKLICWD